MVSIQGMVDGLGDACAWAKGHYDSKPAVKHTVNTVGSYFGTKGAGAALSAVTNEPFWSDLGERLAPIAGGTYLLSASNQISSQGVRDLAHIAIAGAVGWDLAESCINYSGHSDVLNAAKRTFMLSHHYVSDIIGSYRPDVVGAATGAAAGLATKVGMAISRRI